MAKQRINDDHALTQFEKNAIFAERAASIDTELEEAYIKINWERRNAAEKGGLVEWTKTYLISLTLDTPPSPIGEEVLSQMAKAITSHSNFGIALHRGAGKTAFVISTAVYALLTGLQKFIVIICNNQRASNGILNDIFRVFQVPDSALAQDYPEVILPYTIANGSYRRRQLFAGHTTNIHKNSNELFLPEYKDERFQRASGSLVITRSVTSGLRGIRNGTMRPTFAIIDDIQTSQSATSPEQVEKLMDVIRQDIIPLAGKERLSILQTFTPIAPDDLVEKIKNDKAWTTTIYPAIINFPTNMELWEQYFQTFDEESMLGDSHSGSLEFYRSNFNEMNAGAKVFNETRYSEKDGHISMLQKLLELKHQIGENAFNAEYQMKPVKMTFTLDIVPADVFKKVSSTPRLVVPDGYTFVAASTDLNLSKYLTTTIVAFKRDMTSTVIHHEFSPCHVDLKLPDGERNMQIHKVLDEHAKHLKELNVKIDGWGIDASGWPFDVCCQFAKMSMQNYGIPCCAMCGRASHMFSPFARSRLRDAINRTVLCGDAQEQVKSGSGKKYMFWDSDFYRSVVQKAFIAPPSAIGGISLFNGSAKTHTDFAIQVCAEKLVSVFRKQDREMYTWKTNGDHDCLDSLAQAFAIASSQGLSWNSTMQKKSKMPVRSKFRIV